LPAAAGQDRLTLLAEDAGAEIVPAIVAAYECVPLGGEIASGQDRGLRVESAGQAVDPDDRDWPGRGCRRANHGALKREAIRCVGVDDLLGVRLRHGAFSPAALAL